MRVLFTIAIVLVSLSRREVRETGAESVLSALMAGAAAVAFSVLYTFWPQPGAALLAMAFLGLLVVPRAFRGRHQGAVALAIPLVWVLLGTAEGSTLSKTLDWCLYSILGVLYAVGARTDPGDVGLARKASGSRRTRHSDGGRGPWYPPKAPSATAPATCDGTRAVGSEPDRPSPGASCPTIRPIRIAM